MPTLVAPALRLSVVLVFLLLCTNVFGQAMCSLKNEELPAAPELFGFRLGMTKDNVKTLVPRKHKIQGSEEFLA